jgi:hypothetical protein
VQWSNTGRQARPRLNATLAGKEMTNRATKKDAELSIYIERMLRFIQLLRIYDMVMQTPKEEDTGSNHVTMRGTMMAVVYSFFYSLIEKDPKGIDFFRIWQKRRPDMSAELNELENYIEPMREGLRVFRNRFGFHGSTTREHEAPAFDVLKQFDSSQIYRVMIDMRNLSTKLIQAHMAK